MVVSDAIGHCTAPKMHSIGFVLRKPVCVRVGPVPSTPFYTSSPTATMCPLPAKKMDMYLQFH